jgi:succinate dehydrogenase/fumarate reductase flavoprotein subunit
LELGADVRLLEKGDVFGGSLPLSSGYAWSYRDMPTWRREAPDGDAALQELVLRNLEADIRWLEEHGVPILARETGNPLTFGARLDPQGTIPALVRSISVRGGHLEAGGSLAGLQMDGEGAVVGARVRTSSGAERLERADAVVLATGGFAASPELVERYVLRGRGRLRVRAHERSTGDGLRAALAVGARESAGMGEFYGRNLPAPPARYGPEDFVRVSQFYGRYAVAVNARGERYADEAADWSETALTLATTHQPGRRAFYVLAAEGLHRRVRERTAGDMVRVAGEIGATVLEAGTLGRLAARLAERGVSPERFLATIEEYNAAVGRGESSRLSPPRGVPAPPVLTPPFVAVEVAPTITHTMGGVSVDATCRVLRRGDGLPIPGLYAAGVEAGGLAAGGYASGLASAVVFGRTAGAAAGRFPRRDPVRPETRS